MAFNHYQRNLPFVILGSIQFVTNILLRKGEINTCSLIKSPFYQNARLCLAKLLSYFCFSITLHELYTCILYIINAINFKLKQFILTCLKKNTCMHGAWYFIKLNICPVKPRLVYSQMFLQLLNIYCKI